ncbi:MAG: hypothetical protein AB1508_09745 [Pseudomonadota bacterium]
MRRILTTLGLLARRRLDQDQDHLSAETAQAIIEAEIAKRNWNRFDDRDYHIGHLDDGRAIWRCRGFVRGMRGGVMVIEIDARTGDLLRATAGGR